MFGRLRGLVFVPLTIKQGGSGPNSGQVIYTPPRDKAVIQDRLDNLVNFVNDDEQLKTPQTKPSIR